MANEKKRALNNVLNKSLGENLQQGFDQTVKDVTTNPTLGMIGDTIKDATSNFSYRDIPVAAMSPFTPGVTVGDVEDVGSTLINKGIGGVASQGYDALKSGIADFKAGVAPIGTAIMGGREGLAALEAQDKTPAATLGGETTMKSQGGAGMEGAGANLSGMKDFSMTQSQAPGSAVAPGLGVDGDTMTYRSPGGGTATITGPGVGKVNWSKDRLDAGVSTIGDWANQEAKQSMHEAGMNRLRAGLPYDAKEASMMQNSMRQSQQQSPSNNMDVLNAAKKEAIGQIDNAISNLDRSDSGIQGGSRKVAMAIAELQAKKAGIISGTGEKAVEDTTRRDLGFGQLEQSAADSNRDFEAAMSGQRSAAETARLKSLLDQGNADRTFGLDREKLGTEQAKLGLTTQEKQREALGQQQNRMLDSQKEINKLWADTTIDPRVKRRSAVQTRQQAGIPAIQSELMTLEEDQEARDAIASGNDEALSGAYSATSIQLFREQMKKQVQGYGLGK
jgi:hypothetical protein